jgi:two-component system sensor histidine kinase ComP
MKKADPCFPLNVLEGVTQNQEHLLAILHDDIIQIGCQVERSLRDLIEHAPDQSPLHAGLNETTELTAMLLTRLRALVTDLYDEQKETSSPGDDLFVALRALLEEVETRSGLHCVLMTDPSEWVMAEHLHHQLFAIVRELINNSVAHACARWIRVTLCREATMLYVCVEDNGCGFVPQPVERLCAQGHFGLYLLQQRVEQVHGVMHLCSTPAQGTSVTIRVPLTLSAGMDTAVNEGGPGCYSSGQPLLTVL